jgi:hypothetical protein
MMFIRKVNAILHKGFMIADRINIKLFQTPWWNFSNVDMDNIHYLASSHSFHLKYMVIIFKF